MTAYPAAMQCIGILPGIGSYISEDSSDSDKTSNSDLEDMFDFRGQKMQKNVTSQLIVFLVFPLTYLTNYCLFIGFKTIVVLNGPDHLSSFILRLTVENRDGTFRCGFRTTLVIRLCLYFLVTLHSRFFHYSVASSSLKLFSIRSWLNTVFQKCMLDP